MQPDLNLKVSGKTGAIQNGAYLLLRNGKNQRPDLDEKHLHESEKSCQQNFRG